MRQVLRCATVDQIVLDAVDANTGRRLALRRQRHQRRDDLVAGDLLQPVRQQRLGLAEDVGTVLLLLGLGGDDGVAHPFEPDAHAVVVDLVLVADQWAGGNTEPLEPRDQRDIHHLAAGFQLHAAADDGVEIVAHVRAEHVFAHPLAIDLLGELDQFIVAVNVGDGHGRMPFL